MENQQSSEAIVRTNSIKIRVNELEKQTIEIKAEEAGLNVSEFLRELALGNQVRARLTPEEIDCYKTLNKFANNFTWISNTLKFGDITRVKELCIETSNAILTHLNKLK